MFKPLVLGLLLAAVCAPAWAQATRSEVPIREEILSNGTRRYAVEITVGETRITAGLDTGSSGLRVLPNVLKPTDVRRSSVRSDYAYGSGAKLDGVSGSAVVGVGGLKGETTLQVVETVSCVAAKPGCPASRVPLAKYGIQGDGLANEGFKAILGVAMTDADVQSTFMGIGAKRWIIELPRPGERGAGRLILNPTDEEIAGFVALPIMPEFSRQRGGLHDAVPGCLVHEKTKDRICGAVDLDTGAPGIRVLTPTEPGEAWPGNDNATLTFADAGGAVRATENLTLNMRNHASRLTFARQANSRMPVIHSGLVAYFAFSVLYDPEKGALGFKTRRDLPDGPRGRAQ